jgi:hypothetical protein
MEIGNISLTYKRMFICTKKWTLGGGVAVVCPTAENWRYSDQDATATYVNAAVNVVPYLGALWHPNDSTFGQLLVQSDIPVSPNTVRLDGLSRNVSEQPLLRAGAQLGRWFYRNDTGRQSCRLGGFLEVNYTGALDNAVRVNMVSTGNQLLLGATRQQTHLVTVSGGIPVQFGKLSISNAVIVPVTSDRTFSIAYDFSLGRRF